MTNLNQATLPRPSNLNVAKNVAVGTGDTVAKDAPDGKTGSLITAEQPKGNVAGSTDDKLCTEDDKVDEPKKNIAGNN